MSLYLDNNGKYQKDWDALYTSLVSSEGMSKTIGGEVMRAAAMVYAIWYKEKFQANMTGPLNYLSDWVGVQGLIGSLDDKCVRAINWTLNFLKRIDPDRHDIDTLPEEKRQRIEKSLDQMIDIVTVWVRDYRRYSSRANTKDMWDLTEEWTPEFRYK